LVTTSVKRPMTPRKIPTSTISTTSLGFATAIAAETMMIPPVHEVTEVKKRKMTSWGGGKESHGSYPPYIMGFNSVTASVPLAKGSGTEANSLLVVCRKWRQ
jgi:hypothetical protein